MSETQQNAVRPRGWLSKEGIETLAQGLYQEWKASDPEARRAMVMQAYAMWPGCEREAALKFLKLREAHLGGGKV